MKKLSKSIFVLTQLTLVGLLCASCSLFTGSSSSSISISDSGKQSARNWSIETLQKKPNLYQINRLNNSRPMFLTAVESCRISQKRSLASITRQLFVGLKDLRIQDPQVLNIGKQSVLSSKITATVEDTALRLVSYSVRDSNCVRDFVVWIVEQLPQAEADFDFFSDQVLPEIIGMNLE